MNNEFRLTTAGDGTKCHVKYVPFDIYPWLDVIKAIKKERKEIDQIGWTFYLVPNPEIACGDKIVKAIYSDGEESDTFFEYNDKTGLIRSVNHIDCDCCKEREPIAMRPMFKYMFKEE